MNARNVVPEWERLKSVTYCLTESDVIVVRDCLTNGKNLCAQVVFANGMAHI